MKTNIVYLGNCLDVLPTLPDNSVDSIVTDPPYELGFMGKSWDNSGIAYSVPMWKECLRVLKPGGHLLSFSGTRTYHRMAVAIEDAGFEVRDMIEWVYGSGFPKSHNIAKSLDKMEGVEHPKNTPISDNGSMSGANYTRNKMDVQSDLGKKWEGWGTALKPAHEPICMARKPLGEKTVAQNVLKYGTGGINIDESRVGLNGEKPPTGSGNKSNGATGIDFHGGNKEEGNETSPLGRFPANLIHDNSEEVRECFPETKSGNLLPGHKRGDGTGNSLMGGGGIIEGTYGGDSGNASRFFKSIIYQAKASKSERNKGCEGLEEKIGGSMCANTGNTMDLGGASLKGEKKQIQNTKNFHPTVKPIALMEYLIKMITPKGGIVLDPFAGSGSTLVAARDNGFKYIGIEMTEEYLPIIQARTGCEIIHNTKNVIQEEETTIEQEIKEKPIDIQKPKNDIQVCECGGKIKKLASGGRCCEWCIKDY